MKLGDFAVCMYQRHNAAEVPHNAAEVPHNAAKVPHNHIMQLRYQWLSPFNCAGGQKGKGVGPKEAGEFALSNALFGFEHILTHSR